MLEELQQKEPLETSQKRTSRRRSSLRPSHRVQVSSMRKIIQPQGFLEATLESPRQTEQPTTTTTTTTPRDLCKSTHFTPPPPTTLRATPIKCLICAKTFTRHDNLNRHIKTKHPRRPANENNTLAHDPHNDLPMNCDQHDQPADDQPPVQPPNQPLPEDPVVFPQAGVDVQDELFRMMREHWPSIRTHHLTGRPIQDIHNFRMVNVRNLGPGVSEEHALQIAFHHLQSRAKVNISFGLVLRHTVTSDIFTLR